jgi:hypothetical protein
MADAPWGDHDGDAVDRRDVPSRGGSEAHTRLPWLWPGLLAAAFGVDAGAHMDALRTAGFRVAAAIAWLVAVDAIVVLAIFLGASRGRRR